MNPLSTSSAPKLIERPTWIKNGKRKLMSDGGYTMMDSGLAKKTFGNYKGGKYSLKQYGKDN